MRHPAIALALLGWAACSATECAAPPAEPAPRAASTYDPFQMAWATRNEVANLEAAVPPVCYTKTGGTSNACWTCHTSPIPPNGIGDWHLQEAYAFSDAALTNHWRNAFVDRREGVAAIADEEILRYIRSDNYGALRAVLREWPADYPGYRADLDLAAGFDDEGFARDGSHWRAIRYKPFPGTFWPTNGSADDVFVRLPAAFRTTTDGTPSREIYKINLAILEAVVAADPTRPPGTRVRRVEPVDEALAGQDLDRDGRVQGLVTRIVGRPESYAGAAASVPIHDYLYPQGTEFLHTVRYVDPDAPQLLSARLKELRYSRKVQALGPAALGDAYVDELDHKEKGLLPVFGGSPLVGLTSSYGWQLQGFIEDAEGRPRLQTEEEHRFCMGCHGAIGVTVDSTFTLPRKVPGAGGWRHQDLRGIPDVPQAGHGRGEIHTYFERVKGGDELRANDEVRARFFDASGKVRSDLVERAAPGGPEDMTFLVVPSRRRALDIAKAYRVIVLEQSFRLGRDPTIVPSGNVHESIENGDTELAATGMVFEDGRLHLDWSGLPQ